MSAPDAEPKAALQRAAWMRLAGIVVLIVILLVVGIMSGAHRLTHDELREFVLSLGGWGVLAFVGIFVLGQILHCR